MNKAINRNKVQYAVRIIAAAVMTTLLGILVYQAAPFVFADASGDAIDAVIKIIKLVAKVAGALFVLVGILKFAISYANEDGPQQIKAVMMLAAGVVLVILGTLVLDTMDIKSWITV